MTARVATLDEARHLLVTLGDELDAAHREVAALRHRLDRLCRHVFGRRSEKGVPEGQGLLAWPGAARPIAPNASDEDAGTVERDVGDEAPCVVDLGDGEQLDLERRPSLAFSPALMLEGETLAGGGEQSPRQPRA